MTTLVREARELVESVRSCGCRVKLCGTCLASLDRLDSKLSKLEGRDETKKDSPKAEERRAKRDNLEALKAEVLRHREHPLRFHDDPAKYESSPPGCWRSLYEAAKKAVGL